ncbi:MAG: hypothetical protein K0S28_1168 [Paucimonas sp.]|nr:hypothetical protein [Paucimonas sp.]
MIRIMRPSLSRPVSRRRMRGQSFLEYIVVLSVGVLVLVSGTDPPIQKLARAIRDYYTDYSFAISVSSMPNCFYDGSAGPVSYSVDKCIDVKDPEWPVDISFD